MPALAKAPKKAAVPAGKGKKKQVSVCLFCSLPERETKRGEKERASENETGGLDDGDGDDSGERRLA